MGMIDGQEVIYDCYNLGRSSFTEDTLLRNFDKTSSFLAHMLSLVSVRFFGLGVKSIAEMSTTCLYSCFLH